MVEPGCHLVRRQEELRQGPGRGLGGVARAREEIEHKVGLTTLNTRVQESF